MGYWNQIAALSVGGVLGVNARYWLGHWINKWASPQFPWATFTINVSGSFAIGFLTLALARWLPHNNIRLIVVTGFLGGYTTFSTFSQESATLWERGETGRALAYMVGSVVAGFAAVMLGIVLARAVTMQAAERASRKTNSAPIAGAAQSHDSRQISDGSPAPQPRAPRAEPDPNRTLTGGPP
jgi:CrcB protein